MYAEESPAQIQTPTHWNLIGLSLTAKQYSSATLRFHSHKEKFRSHNFFYFF
jgi:hypothetical protein